MSTLPDPVKPMLQEIEVINYDPKYREDFKNLNLAWLNKYFTVEAEDIEILGKPEEVVISKGGHIIFLKYKDEIIGTAALKYVDEETFELAKMAVDEAYQGIGAGKFLCSTAIDKARELGANQVILYSNRSLSAAIGIYHKLGFEEVPLEGANFERANIKMSLTFVL